MKRLIGAVVGSLLVHAILMANTASFFKEPPRFSVKPGTSSVRMTFATASQKDDETSSNQRDGARDAEPETSKPETEGPENTSPETSKKTKESIHQEPVETSSPSEHNAKDPKADPIGSLPSPDPVEQKSEPQPAPPSDPVQPKQPSAAKQNPIQDSQRVTEPSITESASSQSSSTTEPSDVPSDTTSTEEPTSKSDRDHPEETTEDSLREAVRSQARQSGARWVSDAEYRRNPPPTYPTKARVLGQEGTVKLLVAINERGRPTRVVIKQSSGSFLLDQAAQKAVRTWTFVPATEDGRSVPSLTIVPIQFSLER